MTGRPISSTGTDPLGQYRGWSLSEPFGCRPLHLVFHINTLTIHVSVLTACLLFQKLIRLVKSVLEQCLVRFVKYTGGLHRGVGVQRDVFFKVCYLVHLCPRISMVSKRENKSFTTTGLASSAFRIRRLARLRRPPRIVLELDPNELAVLIVTIAERLGFRLGGFLHHLSSSRLFLLLLLLLLPLILLLLLLLFVLLLSLSHHTCRLLNLKSPQLTGNTFGTTTSTSILSHNGVRY
mmetsp:Transcript_5970/g.9173  ORF Transcript_5970/g.9173 Transcript_5970/m.9173 type:complete len:236 (-) Transcript_5970:67-774(-)